jgi:hypothetical protein
VARIEADVLGGQQFGWTGEIDEEEEPDETFTIMPRDDSINEQIEALETAIERCDAVMHSLNENGSNANPQAELVQVNLIGRNFLKDASGADELVKLSKYEAGLERSLYKALHEFQRLRYDRTGERVAPPAVLDVNIASD